MASRVLAFFLCAGLSLMADPPRKMTLAFTDDFAGSQVDTKKWTVPASSPANTVSVRDGKLVLGITQVNGTWTGGALISKDLFELSQGYFEINAKMGTFPGHHFGFRLLPPDKKEIYSEIYVVEAFGADSLITWIRYNDGKALHDEKPLTSLKPFTTPGMASSKFNTYGLLWRDHEYTWYINGKEVYTTKKGLTKDRLCISLVHTVSEFELPKLDPAKLPDDIQVDWVKAWK